MKKALCFLGAVLIILNLSACGSKSGSMTDSEAVSLYSKNEEEKYEKEQEEARKEFEGTWKRISLNDDGSKSERYEQYTFNIDGTFVLEYKLYSPVTERSGTYEVDTEKKTVTVMTDKDKYTSGMEATGTWTFTYSFNEDNTELTLHDTAYSEDSYIYIYIKQ